MPAASILIKPISANCNINCEYCFYKVLSNNREEYNKGFMTEDTLEELVKQAVLYAEGSLTFAFQGGEPMLAGLSFYEKVVSLQEKYKKPGLQIENTIQTNGVLIDEKWAEFFKKHDFLVGLSLDGPKKIHDRFRKDCQEKGTFDTVMHAVEILKKHEVDFNIVSVITGVSQEKASYLYKFYKRNHFPYIQFIPCMDEKERFAGEEKEEQQNEFSITPKGYGKFMCDLFDLWYEDFRQGERMDIRMFSNLAQMAAGYPPEECGMNGCCNCYFVVEGNGDIYPCDFYCTDEWKLGRVGDSFQEMYVSSLATKFMERSKDLHKKCQDCSYLKLCRGGCCRWREKRMNGEPGLHLLCEAYEIFFAHAEERIQRLGTYILTRNDKVL